MERLRRQVKEWRPLYFVLVFIFLLAAAGCTPKTSGVPSSTPRATSPAISVSGSGSALPLVQRLATNYGQTHPLAQFHFDTGTNSGGAIQGVISGTLDLAVVNRRLSESESKEPLNYRPFAVDVVAFAVHTPNPVGALSTAEVRGIYGGDLTRWDQLGGGGEPIVVLDRDVEESSRQLVLLPIMAGRHVGARAAVLNSAADMISALESTPQSIGYTSLGLLRLLGPKAVRPLALDGVAPSPESEGQVTYPWRMAFAIVSRRDAPKSALEFLDFVTGEAGRRLISQLGFATPKP